MKQYILLIRCISLAILLIVIEACSSSIFSIDCLGDNYLLSISRPTIQTVSIYANKEGTIRKSLIRGKIELLNYNELVVIGYNSTRYFDQDNLTDLARENDLEGFFIIEKQTMEVKAGLDGSTFFDLIENNYNLKDIDLLDIKNISFSSSCDIRENE